MLLAAELGAPTCTRRHRCSWVSRLLLLPTDFPRGVCIGRFATVLLLCMGNATGIYVTQPYILFVYTGFFAGQPCETDAQTRSLVCKAAMERYLSINAGISLCQAVLGILLFAVVGRVSDSVGRRRCFVGSMVPMVLQSTMLLLYAQDITSMYPYMATMCVPDFVWVLTFAYIADIMPPHWRATFFAWFIASFGVGNFINSALARYVFGSFGRCAVFGFGCRVAALVLAIFGLPESLPPAARKPPIDWHDRHAVLPVLNSLAQLRVLGRTSIFKRIAVTLFVATLANHGMQAVQPAYLRQQLDFSEENFESQNMIAGVTLTFVNVAVTPMLINTLGEQRTLVLGLAVFLVYCLGYCSGLVRSDAAVYVLTLIQDVSYVIFPAINSLKSTLSGGEEQGQVLGAVNAVQSMGSGLGPALYNWLFALTLQAGHPRLVWWFGAALVLASLGFACWVPNLRRPNGNDSGGSGGGSGGGGAHREDLQQLLLGDGDGSSCRLPAQQQQLPPTAVFQLEAVAGDEAQQTSGTHQSSINQWLNLVESI